MLAQELDTRKENSEKLLRDMVVGIAFHILFGIVSRICKYPRKNASLDSILKHEWKSTCVGIHELVIQNGGPNGLHELAPEMGKHLLSCRLAKSLEIFVLCGVIELDVV